VSTPGVDRGLHYCEFLDFGKLSLVLRTITNKDTVVFRGFFNQIAKVAERVRD